MNFLNLDVQKIIRSRTIWTNFLILVASIITALANHAALGGTISVVAILNIILRVITTKALTKTVVE